MARGEASMCGAWAGGFEPKEPERNSDDYACRLECRGSVDGGCGEVKDSLSCTRDMDHEGPHVTCIGTRHAVQVWYDRPEVDWLAMPKWAKWVAMDADGTWLLYAAEPHVDGQFWGEHVHGNYGTIPLEFAPKWDGPWQESKAQRPEEQQ